MLGDQRGVAEPGGAGQPRGDHGVENPGGRAKTEAIQHAQIEVGAVHDHLGV